MYARNGDLDAPGAVVGVVVAGIAVVVFVVKKYGETGFFAKNSIYLSELIESKSPHGPAAVDILGSRGRNWNWLEGKLVGCVYMGESNWRGW